MADIKIDKSTQVWDFARKHMVAGVSAGTRYNHALGRAAIFEKGEGARLWDADGNELIDLCTSHGGSIMGHKHPAIGEAMQKAWDMGVMCSYETEYQGKLAAKVCEMVPAAELCRYSASGTEATMHAIRLARTVTGREKILKFEGNFHGYHDYVQFSWGPDLKDITSENESPKVPDGPGIPKGVADYCLVAPYNNIAAMEKIIEENKDDLAAVICEPINYNTGCVIPDKIYMQAMRDMCIANDILLIYDEVLSAFRMGPDCAQGYLGITPDICTIGKSVAGGMPLGVIAGKKEYMQHITPLGKKSAHSGTYTGHLTAVLASIASLNEISSEGFYDKIYASADRLYSGLNELIQKHKVKARVQGLGARFGIYMGIDSDTEVKSYRDAAKLDKQAQLKLYKLAYENGVYFHDYGGTPSHHGFSIAHTVEVMDEVIDRLDCVFAQLA